MSTLEGGSAPRSLLTMTWRDALFAHWEAPEPLVADRLPAQLSVDTHDGRAFLGVVPFVMEDISPRGVPVGLSFGEVNLRTYVEGPDGTRGVYFFNLDADDRLGVFLARRLFGLPYYRAEMTVTRRGREVQFSSQRRDGSATFDATYEPTGDRFTAEPGSLPHFLTERYRFYTEGGDHLYYGDIAHEPWLLAEATAEFHANGLFVANGFDHPDDEPHLLYSPRIEVTAGRVHRA